MKPAEVADLIGVEPGTVSDWAKAGKVPASRTPGGQWRFRPADVEALMAAHNQPDNENGPVRCVSTETSP